MELVEGQTLAQRIERGALELEEAIDIVTQVAAGLDAAHAKGIIHRDLKPANVMITEDGTVKVLDFGLAKALEGDAAESVEDSNSPTLSRAATQAGVLLGTAGYMSPEQARGKPVDKRADIWALGVVLFEMLTGTRLFHGETMSDTLAAVLKTEPDWTALPAETPWLLKRLLRRCLEKNQKERLHDVADVRLELQDAMTSSDEAPRNARRTTPGIAVSGGALVGLLVGVAIVAHFTQRAPESPIRFSMEVPVLGFGPGQVALSRDGRSLAFGSRDPTALYHRSLGARDDVASSALAVGGGAFFSLPMGGGSAFTPDWSPDGRVLFYRDWARAQIRALSETGEVSSLVTSEGNLLSPRVSPDGGFIAYVSDISGREEVYVVPFPEADRRHTISTDGGHSPVWSRDGRELFYVTDDRLMTVAVETADGFRVVVFYIESRRFLIRDSPRPATTYEQKTGGADGVKGA